MDKRMFELVAAASPPEPEAADAPAAGDDFRCLDSVAHRAIGAAPVVAAQREPELFFRYVATTD